MSSCVAPTCDDARSPRPTPDSGAGTGYGPPARALHRWRGRGSVLVGGGAGATFLVVLAEAGGAGAAFVVLPEAGGPDLQRRPPLVVATATDVVVPIPVGAAGVQARLPLFELLEAINLLLGVVVAVLELAHAA